MKIILILLLRLSLFYCDKLDRTYLPPPGSNFSGGRTDDLQPPFVIDQPPGFSQQNNVPGIKNGDDYIRPISKPPRDRNVFDSPRDRYDVTYEDRNLTSSNPLNQNLQGQNKNPFTPTVSPSVTSSTISTDKPSYSQFGPDSFANPAFKPNSYNPELAQPGRFSTVKTQITNNGRYNLEDEDSKRPQPGRFSNVPNQTNNNRLYKPQTDDSERAKADRLPSVPGQINDNRKYGSHTGDLNDFQGNYRQPSQTTNLPNLSESPNVNYQYKINQKDQYPSINEYSPQSKAPGQVNNDQTPRLQDNSSRPQQKGQFNSGNISSYQPNQNLPDDRPSNPSEIYNSPSFNTDFPKQTSIIPSYPGTYQPNYQNNTGNIYPETTTPSGTASYPESDNARLSAFYKRPERPQSALERNAVILNYKNILTPEGFDYSFDTSNGIHADEKGTAIDGVKAEGSFSYTGDDGKFYEVVYSADENGFRPSGDHLPTPPPIPEAIQRVIEEAERNRDAGVVHDGFYDDKKYGHKKYDKTRNQNKPRKPRPESDESNIYDNDNDQEDFPNKESKSQKKYYQDSDDEGNLPERGYQTETQNGKLGENYDDESDDNKGGSRRPINQETGQRQSDDRIPQYKQRGQQRKPIGANTSSYAKKPNGNQYPQKQPGKINNQQFDEDVPDSEDEFIVEDSYNRDNDRADIPYPEQDNISIFDARDRKENEKNKTKRPGPSDTSERQNQKNKGIRPRTEIREKTRLLSQKPQKNNDNLSLDDQYQTQSPEYDFTFANRQENINNYEDDSEIEGKDKKYKTIDKKYFKDDSDKQDYDFIEPDRITNENEDNFSYYSKIGGSPKVASSQRNKTKQRGYAYLPPSKQFYYETTTSSTRKPDYQDIKNIQNGVNLDLEAPYTTQRPYTRYSTNRPSQNRLIPTTDRPSVNQPSFDSITEKRPYIQETNTRIFNLPEKIVTTKPTNTFVETSTKPYNYQTRPSPKKQNYPYYKDTYQGTSITPNQGPFEQKNTKITFGTTTPSPAIFEQTQMDQNYPIRPQNVENDFTLQQQVYTTEIPKRAYETGYSSTTFRPKVRPDLTYEGKRPDTQKSIPETRPSNFETPNQYVEPERYPTKERPGYNQYETPTEYQQTTTPNHKEPTYRQDYISGETRFPNKTPGFFPKQSQRPNETKTTTTNPRYQTTQRPYIPVKVTEDTTQSYGYPEYEPSPNQPGKVNPNYLNEREEDIQQDKVSRPAFRPTTVYPSTFRPKETEPSQTLVKNTQTTQIYPAFQTDYPDERKETYKPYQRTKVFSPAARPKQPSDLTQGVLSTTAYPESQNINYSKTINKFTPNQPIPRPSNTYPGLKPSQVQEIPGNVTQDTLIDRTRPEFKDENYPNVGQDSKLGDGNQPQNIPIEYYLQVKPKDNRFEEPKKPSFGSFSTQSRPRIPGFQEKDSQDLPEIKLPKNRPSIGNNFDQEDLKGQNRDINSSYPSPTPEIIGEDFSGPKQPPRFDPKTGYHY